MSVAASAAVGPPPGMKVRLSSNESAWGPSPRAVEAATRTVEEAWSTSSTRSSRRVDSVTAPSIALAPPDRPVPSPRGTTATRAWWAARSTACTSAVLDGNTAATGTPAGTSPASSRRWPSSTSGSVTTASSGSRSRSVLTMSTDVLTWSG